MSDQGLLHDHCTRCDASQTIVYPDPGTYLYFQNPYKTYSPAHVAFFATECIADKNCNGITNSSGVLTVHRGSAYSCIIIDRNGRVVDTFKYCGSDSSTHFVKRLMSVWRSIKKYIPNYALHMTCEDIRGFSEAIVCCICNIPFTKGVKNNRHHNHMVCRNNYSGACCTRCNLQMRNRKMILPVLAHNVSYNISIILFELSLDIPIQGVQIGDLGFLDSMAFMSGGLNSISQT